MKLSVDMPWGKDLSVNHMRYGPHGGYRKKPHVQAWMSRLAEEIGLWLFEHDHFDGYELPVSVRVAARFPDKRRRDDHNFYKVICDAVADGLGVDDKDIRISTKSIEVDRKNPGFTIEITDEEESDA